ncbi:transcription factor TFIIIB subunit BRF1 KNAG_0E00630 [Huiozyma naganishii CBS 8797]|uniref:B-related factor 1 n=1 Tax=Huiozyma naganishii (strain ATCC MYA-139 / BCRC 22969 / CBS 8797 / KCTC 17520 / NBRC 10181 / NCYC 3082 / Yp74L-3) TaxID=1071383 RepID=J7S7G7_HUIN7|nr:hypothetical protein KNAG_0E00630 [Kazachstania naganishii CBS 8797]CCK70331.1 hypothetical protein KNAG_0E00630 [Kazachstania naganishii CBS 8797]
MPVCKNCKKTEFVRDLSNANNDLVCQNCGVVSEDNPIVSEVTFGETSSGAAMVQGSFISAGQSHASFMSHGGSSALDSREATLNNARRKLRAVSHALSIPDYITDAAFQWYKLALSYNFVQGRRSQNVIAACLYVACRKEKTHHMLIDFSSRLQVSVYSIGATFLKMVKRLHITKLPMADPSLFIQHFAEKLDLGDKKIKVVKDAVKLAQRMSDDWMFEGRRPAGIAGACVLLACRMNNLRRTHTEIVSVSHVAEDTLQERLNEFKATGAGKLSVKEFREDPATADQAARPPSFARNRKNEKKIKEAIRQNELTETSEEALKRDPILSQVMSAQELSSREVLFYLNEFSKKREKVFKRIKATHGIDDEDIHRAEVETKKRKEEEKGGGADKNTGDESDKSDQDADAGPQLRRSKRINKKKIMEMVQLKVQTEKYENELSSDSESSSEEENEREGDVTSHGKFQDSIDGYSLEKDPYRPLNLHLLPKTNDFLGKIKDDEEDLADVDDEEIETLLLDEEAASLKERIWVGINEEYLLEQEEKRLKEEADMIAGNTSTKRKRNGTKGRKRKLVKIEVDTTSSVGAMDALIRKSEMQEALKLAEESGDATAADSVKNMLQKASFSKKINYNAIDNLFKR